MGKAYEDIKKALCVMCLTKNIDDISVNEIVKKAGYSRTYFYHNFNSKEDLIDKILCDEAKLYTFACHLDGNPETYNEKYREMSVNLLNHIYNNKYTYFAILNNHLAKNSRQLFCNKAKNFLFNKITVEFDPKLNINPDIYFEIAIMRYVCFIEYWMNHDFIPSPEVFAGQIVAIGTLHNVKNTSEDNKYKLSYF